MLSDSLLSISQVFSVFSYDLVSIDFNNFFFVLGGFSISASSIMLGQLSLAFPHLNHGNIVLMLHEKTTDIILHHKSELTEGEESSKS